MVLRLVSAIPSGRSQSAFMKTDKLIYAGNVGTGFTEKILARSCSQRCNRGLSKRCHLLPTR